MENLGKKVGYLKGLMEGMAFDVETPNRKLMRGVVDLLEELSDRVESLDKQMDEINEYVDSIDEDVSTLMDEDWDEEDDFFDDDDDDAEDFDEDRFDGGESRLRLLGPDEPDEPVKQNKPVKSDEPDEPGEEENALAGNLCPECHFLFVTSLKDAEGSRYVCPNCGKKVVPMPLTGENAPLAKPVEE